jgi:alkaline phosphatase D
MISRLPLAAPVLVLVALAGQTPESRQATGVKVGEVTDTSAVVWARLTARSERNGTGDEPRGRVGAKAKAEDVLTDQKVAELRGACPGASGRVRVRHGLREDLSDAAATDWADVGADRDFTHQFRLTGLRPDTVYHYAVESAGPGGSPQHGPVRGRFRTAPPRGRVADVVFTVLACQGYMDLDHADGFHIYPAMAALNPHFLIATGDSVYYDSEAPRARTVALARYHWQRMYSLPRHIDFHLRVPAFWEKDDHDCYDNDCWPGKDSPMMRPLTFAEGQRVFREQVPMGEKTYRTVRWGKALEIWLVEGRDFRSPNPTPDGPAKTIWGAEQKRWLMDTLRASDALWKVLVSPTPLIGPDRGQGKHDNHSNAAFRHEGDEVRQWFADNLKGNFFIACGDRHWQYHSVHPGTKLHEFSCGAASDEHAAGSPGEDPAYHRFHRVKGGFLSVAVRNADGRSTVTFRFHDVHGGEVYSFAQLQPLP